MRHNTFGSSVTFHGLLPADRAPGGNFRPGAKGKVAVDRGVIGMMYRTQSPSIPTGHMSQSRLAFRKR
jgi:hypothetical protein